MAIKPVLRMGDPRLLAPSHPVKKFRTPELSELITDMRDTMISLQGAGLAAPQIGVNLQVVIFGVEANARYPDAEAVPFTILINPTLTPVGDEIEAGCRVAYRCRACAAWYRVFSICAIRGLMKAAGKLTAR